MSFVIIVVTVGVAAFSAGVILSDFIKAKVLRISK